MKIEFSAKDISKLYEEHKAIDEILNHYRCNEGTAYKTDLGIMVRAFESSHGHKLNDGFKDTLIIEFEDVIRSELNRRALEIKNTFDNLGLKLA